MLKLIQKPYRQEGAIVPFTCFPWFSILSDLPEKYFPGQYEHLIIYFVRDYGYVYWDKEIMDPLAEKIYQRFQKQKNFSALFKIFLKESYVLEKFYYLADSKKIFSFEKDALVQYFSRLKNIYAQFWKMGIFIDAFDAGFDQCEIERVRNKYNFTIEEVITLTTSPHLTFTNERVLYLLELVNTFKKNKILSENLLFFIQENQKIKRYKKCFDFYRSNYTTINHISDEDIFQEMNKYLEDQKSFDEEYQKLFFFEKELQKRIQTILKNNGLRENPLGFFAQLTFWREYRKKVNLMGIHILFMILSSLELKTGIGVKYLSYLTFDEFEIVLKGFIGRKMLERRRENGILFFIEGKEYTTMEADEARAIYEDLEQLLYGEDLTKNTIFGQCASPGYAKGVVKIILTQNDFSKFRDNDILVSGMTRPEFVSFMKKAKAIVTNEGGVTCHAAIVARELGKPCVIGTKNATTRLKDGDLVEVRATHGTIRILSRSS